MESFFWYLANRTAEARFIFNLFHLLLVGLTLLVLLHRLRARPGRADRSAEGRLALGFLLLALHFALLAGYFASQFFFQKELGWTGVDRLGHGLLACGVMLVVSAYLHAGRDTAGRELFWLRRYCGFVLAVVMADALASWWWPAFSSVLHSPSILVIDLLTLLAIAVGIWAVLGGESEGRLAGLIAMSSLGMALLLHNVARLLPQQAEILIWNGEQHLLSVSFFAFAWASGERSHNLLDRVFVRLNLTFIVLASLIMLTTASMEKYQYFRLAEERSMNLAEFLRGHVVYYRSRGEDLQNIFRHPEVLRRVVVEFGTLPELREVKVYLEGLRATFRYAEDMEIKEEIVPISQRDVLDPEARVSNAFRMVRLPIENGAEMTNRIEFVGTMNYINKYIGEYLILIYTMFTIMVGLATAIIGMIIADTDRRLHRQYAELQETQQQLAHSAKLASIGQLAGGVAHEINTPITSILSLASHLANGKSTAAWKSSHRNSLKLIADQAERVSKIVSNLLTFSRQSRLDLTRIDVREALEAAIALVQYRLKSGNVQFLREFSEDRPLVLGNTGRLTEVFVNLMNNALDAMPHGGTLRVQAFPTADPDSAVRVEISDTGCGIPEENLERIFDPFFTTKEVGKGTGLGLSISHGIVKDHGGQIWVRSQPDRSTTFVVTLPQGGHLS